jgi:protein-disulfide isomerase
MHPRVAGVRHTRLARKGIVMGRALRLLLVATVGSVGILSCAFALGRLGPALGWSTLGADIVRVKDDPVSTAELLKPGPLPELSLGRDDAPITIVEYADLTCPHCADFHSKVLPVLKQKYIDTGKARLLFREFPLNTHSLMAFMSVRCAAPQAAFPLMDMLFSHQDDWSGARSAKALAGKLFGPAQQAGLTRQAFDDCVPSGDAAVTDRQKQLIKDISAVRDRADKTFGVDSTPTFFVNGKKLTGPAIEDFDKAIGAELQR